MKGKGLAMTKIEDWWAGGDPDDVSGYLMDYLSTKFSVGGEPLTDEAIQVIVKDCPDFIKEIITNICYAVRAKAEDFDE